MGRVALDTVLCGIRGEIQAGEDIPETYEDLQGVEHATDFDRLEELGLVEPEGDAPAGKRRAKKDKTPAEPEGDAPDVEDISG